VYLSGVWLNFKRLLEMMTRPYAKE